MLYPDLFYGIGMHGQPLSAWDFLETNFRSASNKAFTFLSFLCVCMKPTHVADSRPNHYKLKNFENIMPCHCIASRRDMGYLAYLTYAASTW